MFGIPKYKHWPQLFWHTIVRDKKAAVCVLLFIVLSIICQVPLWLGKYIPGLDIPNHIAIASVIRHYSDSVFNFSSYFALDRELSPYLLLYYSLAALGTVVTVETAMHLWVALFALLLPISVAYALKAFNRAPAYALLAFPFVYEFHFISGYVAYRSSLVLMLFTFAAIKINLASPRLRREMVIFILSCLLFLCHAHGYLIIGVAAGTLLVLGFRGALPWIRTVIALVPSLLMAGYWGLSVFSAKPVAHRAATSFEWKDPLVLMQILPTRIFNVLSSNSDEWLLLLWALTVALLFALPRSGNSAAPSSDKLRESAVPAIVMLLMVVLYFVFPVEIRATDRVFGLSYRFIAPIFLFLILAIDRPLTWPILLGLVPVVLATVIYVGLIGKGTAELQERMNGLDDIIAAMEPGKRVLPINCKVPDPRFNWGSLRYSVGYYLARKGGVAASQFVYAFYRYMPVSYKPAAQLPSPDERHFNYSVHGKYFDYFWVIDGDGFRCDPLQRQGAPVALVKESGFWRLYRNDGAGAAKP